MSFAPLPLEFRSIISCPRIHEPTWLRHHKGAIVRPAFYSPTHLRDTALKPLIVLRFPITLQPSPMVRSSYTNRCHSSKQFILPAELQTRRYIASAFDLLTDVRRLLWSFHHEFLQAPATIATTRFPELTNPLAVGGDVPHGNGPFEPHLTNNFHNESRANSGRVPPITATFKT